jgi:hypothetical protein
MKVVDAFLHEHPFLTKGDSFRNATILIGPLSNKLETIPNQQFDVNKDEIINTFQSMPVADDKN